MAGFFNNNTSSNGNGNNGQWEKAKAFINFSLPSNDGTDIQIGAIALKESSEVDQLVMQLGLDKEENLQKFMNALRVNYKVVVPVSKRGFKLD